MITCLIGKEHAWIAIGKGRRRCQRCKLTIHEPGKE